MSSQDDQLTRDSVDRTCDASVAADNKKRKLGEASSAGAASAVPLSSSAASSQAVVCPYLDTINRKLLNFDFEKQCSVSLSTLNVYACLVCGKYFQGRGRNSHAYFHALEVAHHVFINLETEKAYCSPEGYEVVGPSLDDIRYNLHPRFTRREAQRLGAQSEYCHALDGDDYLPGIKGLNNVNKTDWMGATIFWTGGKEGTS